MSHVPAKDLRADPPSGIPWADTPFLETDRLRVFKVAIAPTDHHDWRSVYLAFRTDVDCVYPCVVATIWECVAGGHLVEWVETCEDDRRRGFGYELMAALLKHYGPKLTWTPVTKAGEALSDKLEALEATL